MAAELGEARLADAVGEVRVHGVVLRGGLGWAQGASVGPGGCFGVVLSDAALGAGEGGRVEYRWGNERY